jgi:hypothetical protein
MFFLITPSHFDVFNHVGQACKQQKTFTSYLSRFLSPQGGGMSYLTLLANKEIIVDKIDFY